MGITSFIASFILQEEIRLLQTREQIRKDPEHEREMGADL